jgi:hypothetical protein
MNAKSALKIDALNESENEQDLQSLDLLPPMLVPVHQWKQPLYNAVPWPRQSRSSLSGCIAQFQSAKKEVKATSSLV